LYAIQLAGALVQAQNYRRILVVGAEVHSTGLDISTRGRDIAVLFGDGAGSCLVEAVDDAGSTAQNHIAGSLELIGTELHSDGAFVRELWCEHPGSAHFPTRITPELVSEGRVYPLMNGRKVFEHAVRAMTEVSRSLLEAKEFSPKDVSLFVPHQANIRINSMVAAQLGLSESQVWNTIEQYGNTTAATIPIGISAAQQAGRLAAGDLVLSAAFGSGFTWGAALFRVR
jgi:3-oxoacyl-[acyl-carrier-protein] synthase-3